jgi:hypothetical protein
VLNTRPAALNTICSLLADLRRPWRPSAPRLHLRLDHADRSGGDGPGVVGFDLLADERHLDTGRVLIQGVVSELDLPGQLPSLVGGALHLPPASAVLVRPDGHVAWIGTVHDTQSLRSTLTSATGPV